MATCKELTDTFLLCSICGDVYNKPTTLPCGHTLCFDCLVAYAQSKTETTRKKAIPCPYCRHWNEVPGGNTQGPVRVWVAQFKPNIALQNLVDTFHRQEKHCNSCGGTNREAEVYCAQCQKAFCKRCKVLHNENFKDHQLVLLTEVLTSAAPNERDGICLQHPNQSLELFCQNCMIPICPMCGATTHKRCDKVVPLSELSQWLKSAIAADLKNLRVKISVMNHKVSSMEKQKLNFLTQCNQTRKGIQLEAKYLREVISEKEKVLLKQLGDFEGKYEHDVNTNIASGEKAIRLTKHTLEYTKRDEDLTTFEDFQRFKTVNVQLKAQETPLSLSGDKTPDVRWQPNSTLLTEIQQANLGLLKLSLETAKPTTKQACLHKRILEVDKYTLLDIDIVDVNGVDIAATVVYDGDFCVWAFSLSSQKLPENRLVLSEYSWTVSKFPPGRIMISLHRSASITIINVKPMLSVAHSFKTKKEYKSLAALTSDTIVAGTDTPPSVDILDISGEILKSFDNNSFGGEVLACPFYICIDQDYNILVSDCNTKRLTCLTVDGSVLFRYPSSERPGSRMKSPHGVAVDKEGSIFIVDHQKPTVVQLTKTGHFVKEVVGADILKNPHGICFDSKGNMLVTQANEVLIFEFQ